VSERWATFDCYGTLIDWNAGIRGQLARIFGDAGADELLGRYHAVEPEIQAAEPSLSYREVMARALDELGAPTEEREALGDSLPSWTPFPEVPARLGVPFDATIVASEIGSYKPALGHWQAFERETGHLPDVHVGASLFHDVAPANGLCLPTVWVNRLGERAGPEPTREIHDLAPLPDVLDELVPA
jgi:2-haloacid dehalogenase